MLVSLVAALVAASPVSPAADVAEVDLLAQAASTPVTVGQSVSGVLGAGDATLQTGEFADYYVLNAAAGQTVAISLQSSQFDTYVFVRGASLSADNDDAVPGETDSRLQVTFPATGAVTVAVTSYAPGEIGAYELAITDLGAGVVPVAAGQGAPTPGPGQAQQGTLAQGDGLLPTGEFVDSWPLSGTAGDRMRIELRSAAFDTYLGLLGPNGFQLANDDAPGMGTDSLLDVILPHTGQYTVQVTSYRPGETGPYSLSMGANTSAPTVTHAELTVGATISGTLDVADDQLVSGEFADYYVYQGTAGEVITIDQRATDLDSYLLLRGPAGFSLDNDDVAEGVFDAQIRATLPTTGEYRIVATSYSPGELGTYTLSVRRDGTATIAGNRLREGRSTDGELTASSGVRTTGQYSATHTFDGRAGDRVLIELSSSDFDTFLELQMPNGFSETNDDISGDDLNSRLSLTLPVDGTYTVVASSYRPGEVGRYVLNLATDDVVATAAAAAPTGRRSDEGNMLVLGQSLDGELTTEDRHLNTGEFFDVFAFEADGGTTMTVTLESEDVDTYLIVRGPNDWVLENDDAPGLGLSSRVEFSTPTQGRYTVLATTYAAGETGHYALSLAEGTAAQNAGRGQIYAILAGISSYGGAASDLPFCAEDAVKLQQSLASTGLLAPESVLLVDGQVTHDALRDAFRRVGSQVTEDDVFVFFYSGHGAQVAGAELDGQDETLFVVDGNVTDDEVAGWFDDINARVAMVALDSCFSGGFARDVISQPGRMGVFSSEEDVTSNVASRFNAGGYLSYFLRDAFEGMSDNDPADGVITAGELTQYLRREWANHLLNERVETADTESTYQNLVVERGAVKVSDVLVYPVRN